MNTPNYIHRWNRNRRQAFLRSLSGRTADGRELSDVKVNAKGELVE